MCKKNLVLSMSNLSRNRFFRDLKQNNFYVKVMFYDNGSLVIGVKMGKMRNYRMAYF
jgi:hypothetical protein